MPLQDFVGDEAVAPKRDLRNDEASADHGRSGSVAQFPRQFAAQAPIFRDRGLRMSRDPASDFCPRSPYSSASSRRAPEVVADDRRRNGRVERLRAAPPRDGHGIGEGLLRRGREPAALAAYDDHGVGQGSEAVDVAALELAADDRDLEPGRAPARARRRSSAPARRSPCSPGSPSASAGPRIPGESSDARDAEPVRDPQDRADVARVLDAVEGEREAAVELARRPAPRGGSAPRQGRWTASENGWPSPCPRAPISWVALPLPRVRRVDLLERDGRRRGARRRSSRPRPHRARAPRGASCPGATGEAGVPSGISRR